jgi:hypothetical protein
MAVRAGTSRFVVAQMARGKSPREAVQDAVEDVFRLRDGLLRTFVIHAVDTDGNAYAAAIDGHDDNTLPILARGAGKARTSTSGDVSICYSCPGLTRAKWRGGIAPHLVASLLVRLRRARQLAFA